VTERWEHFPHQADVGIRGVGPTREAAFEQAALALTAAVTDPRTVAPSVSVEIDCPAAASDDLLLYAWLNAVAYEMAVRRMLFRDFTVRIGTDGLHGQARGEPIARDRHQPAVEVKGATMTELAVRRCGRDWLAQCVIDV